MDFFTESLRTALGLIAARDPDVVNAVTVSIVVSLWSTLLAALVGIPAGVTLGSVDARQGSCSGTGTPITTAARNSFRTNMGRRSRQRPRTGT